MGEKILTREEKLELLDRRLDEIRRGNTVIERFETAIDKWLKKELETKKAKEVSKSAGYGWVSWGGSRPPPDCAF